jgi:hypothetical protein
MSLKYDHKIYSTEVSSHFEIYLSDLFCVMTYWLVFSRKVRTHLSTVCLVVIVQRYLSRGLTLFVNKEDNKSSHRGGQKDRFQSPNSPQWCTSYGHTSTTFITWRSHFGTSLAALLCVKTYCLVFSWRMGGHVKNVVDVWPQDLHHWGLFALWSLSFYP